MKNNKGFTIIELLVVIGIIAILASVVIVALNPARQFAVQRCDELGQANDESCIEREMNNPSNMYKSKNRNTNRW